MKSGLLLMLLGLGVPLSLESGNALSRKNSTPVQTITNHGEPEVQQHALPISRLAQQRSDNIEEFQSPRLSGRTRAAALFARLGTYDSDADDELDKDDEYDDTGHRRAHLRALSRPELVEAMAGQDTRKLQLMRAAQRRAYEDPKAFYGNLSVAARSELNTRAKYAAKELNLRILSQVGGRNARRLSLPLQPDMPPLPGTPDGDDFSPIMVSPTRVSTTLTSTESGSSPSVSRTSTLTLTQ